MARTDPGSSTPAPGRTESVARWGTLFLEDGARFDGAGVGASGARVGEVVFTTGMVGYPESLTDPSYRGQILVFTYPLLGNYGVPPRDARDGWGLPRYLEAETVQVRGMVARGITRPSHWNGSRALEDWLAFEDVPGVAGVDTRRLTEHLRTHGVRRGILAVGSGRQPPSDQDLRRRIAAAPAYAEEPLVAEISPREPHLYSANGGPVVALLDCGVKASIVRALLDRGLSVLRLPWDTPVPDRAEGRRVSGLVVGNGPGDPANLEPTVDSVRDALRSHRPTLGICLGHQLLALAKGGRTYKLKFGHRGQNKAVRFADGRAYILSENHGFAVDPASLRGSGFRTWATNLDDGTLEGLRDSRGRVLALQGHPEGHPGPQEAGFVFDRFAERVRREAP